MGVWSTTGVPHTASCRLTQRSYCSALDAFAGHETLQSALRGPRLSGQPRLIPRFFVAGPAGQTRIRRCHLTSTSMSM